MTGCAVVAVDWSGRTKRASEHIWRAAVRDGVVSVLSGLDREATVHSIIEESGRCADLTVGLDFSFGYPEWFTRSLGCSSIGELWGRVAVEGEAWLASCDPPFWGRRGSRRPTDVEVLRTTERPDRFGGRLRPFSTFQIGGSGAVGVGSVRGMPYLTALRAAGFSIWPFDPPEHHRIIEIYPRLFSGPVVKSDGAERERYLTDLETSGLEFPREMLAIATSNEDAFDAFVSVVGMWRQRDDLRALRPIKDPTIAIEGAIYGAANASFEHGARVAGVDGRVRR
jgi:hypothetical protein